MSNKLNLSLINDNYEYISNCLVCGKKNYFSYLIYDESVEYRFWATILF